MRLSSVSQEMIALALREDLGPGDITSSLVPDDRVGAAELVAKSSLVLAGVDAFAEVYRQLDTGVRVTFDVAEGTQLSAGTVAGSVAGSSRSLLEGERVALNLLQRLCGIATLSRRAADAVAGTNARIVDTRKTTPGLRQLEKHAVRVGGAGNHRFGLFDGGLDNQVRVAGLDGGADGLARSVDLLTNDDHGQLLSG